MSLLCFQGESAVSLCREKWLQNETDNLFRLLVKVLEYNNWHFLHSYGSITMETATKPGSLNFDSKYFLTLRDGGKGGRHTISTPPPAT